MERLRNLALTMTAFTALFVLLSLVFPGRDAYVGAGAGFLAISSSVWLWYLMKRGQREGWVAIMLVIANLVLASVLGYFLIQSLQTLLHT